MWSRTFLQWDVSTLIIFKCAPCKILPVTAWKREEQELGLKFLIFCFVHTHRVQTRGQLLDKVPAMALPWPQIHPLSLCFLLEWERYKIPSQFFKEIGKKILMGGGSLRVGKAGGDVSWNVCRRDG